MGVTPFGRMIARWGDEHVARALTVRVRAGATLHQLALEYGCSKDRLWALMRRLDAAGTEAPGQGDAGSRDGPDRTSTRKAGS